MCVRLSNGKRSSLLPTIRAKKSWRSALPRSLAKRSKASCRASVYVRSSPMRKCSLDNKSAPETESPGPPVAGSGYGIRTRVSALRGRYPGPLDESASPNRAHYTDQDAPCQIRAVAISFARCPSDARKANALPAVAQEVRIWMTGSNGHALRGKPARSTCGRQVTPAAWPALAAWPARRCSPRCR